MTYHRKWRARRTLTLAVLIPILLVIGAATLQWLTDLYVDRRYPPPGELVEANGLRLHLITAGLEHEGPLVVLDAGGGSHALQWGWIQPEVARFARVVAYDRPGLGWSDHSPRQQLHDGRDVVDHLRAALAAKGLRGPVVHVGHSLGSPIGRTFLNAYPDEVAGLVMVDPRYLRTEAVIGESAVREGEALQRWMPLLARVGIPRWLGGIGAMARGLPENVRAPAIWRYGTTHHLTGLASEWAMGNRTTDALEQSAEDLGSRPTVVLSSGMPDEAFDTLARARFTTVQQDLARLSRRGEHRMVANADHYSIVTDSAQAVRVVQAIRDVLVQLQPPADDR